MKEKLKLALVNKYKKLGYSQKALDAVLRHLEKSVTKEEEIDDAVDGIEDLLETFQKEIDTRVTKAVDKAKTEVPKPEDTKPEEGGAPAKDEKKPGEPAKPSEEVPAWAKALIASNDKLANEISTIKAGKTTESRKQILEDKLKDANPQFKTLTLKNFSRMKFDTEEEFNTYVEEVETDMGEFTQSSVEENLKGTGKPSIAGGKKKAEASEKEVDAIVSQIM